MRQQVTVSLDKETYLAFQQRCKHLRYVPSRELDELIKQWLADHAPAQETPDTEQPDQVYDAHTHHCPFCDTFYQCGCDDKELLKDCEEEECYREHPLRGRMS
jgi:hypothetical protein